MRDLKDFNRNIHEFSSVVWILQLVAYSYISGYMYKYEATHPLLRSIARFDMVMSFLQFVFYMILFKTRRLNKDEFGNFDDELQQSDPNYSLDQGNPNQVSLLNGTRQDLDKSGFDRTIDIINNKTVEWDARNERDGYDGLKKAKIALQNDIYCLAFASFIDPEQLNGQPGFLGKIPMNDDEVTAIYLGALMVICIQLTVIGLVGNYEATAPNFVVAPAHEFTITIARFLAYYMMHLNVEPEIRNGLILCKYCLNHPGCFKL